MKKYTYEPDYGSPPGYTLNEIIKHKNITIEEFSVLTNISVDVLEKLIIGEIELSVQIANILEIFTEVPYTFWLTREKFYREHLSKKGQ